jgi:hypothetical protein
MSAARPSIGVDDLDHVVDGRVKPGKRVGDMADPWWNDDDALLAALNIALNPDEPVPDDVMRTAVTGYAWHDLDAELAALTHDSAADDSELTRTRAEPAIPRALTFEASDVTFELEARPGGLAGLLVAAEGSELELQPSKGETIAVDVNRHGYFTIAPIPDVPFRLRCSRPSSVRRSSWTV